jgi:hypothetical protein
VQYELLKATLPSAKIRESDIRSSFENSTSANTEGAALAGTCNSVPGLTSCRHKCKKCAKKSSTSSSDTAVDDKCTDIPQPDIKGSRYGCNRGMEPLTSSNCELDIDHNVRQEFPYVHTEDGSVGSQSSKTVTPDLPQALKTASAFVNTVENNSDEIVYMQQAATLCDMLKDLGDDRARLSERIEGLRQDLLEKGVDESDVELKNTMEELEYNFKLYAANNHSLEVAMMEVASMHCRGTDGPAPSIAQRLYDLSGQAERLFNQNTLQGDVLGLKRDPRSCMSSFSGLWCMC